MMMFHNRPISILILYAVALHWAWAALLIGDHAAVNANAVNALYRYIHPPELLAFVLFGGGLLAIIGIFTRPPWIILLLIPQQIMLWMSAAGAIESIWLEQFADGVLRPTAFIAIDQIDNVLVALAYSVAMVAHVTRAVR